MTDDPQRERERMEGLRTQMMVLAVEHACHRQDMTTADVVEAAQRFLAFVRGESGPLSADVGLHAPAQDNRPDADAQSRGGQARALNLSKAQRVAQARHAANSRWNKSAKPEPTSPKPPRDRRAEWTPERRKAHGAKIAQALNGKASASA